MKWISCVCAFICSLLDLPPTSLSSHPSRSLQSTTLSFLCFWTLGSIGSSSPEWVSKTVKELRFCPTFKLTVAVRWMLGKDVRFLGQRKVLYYAQHSSSQSQYVWVNLPCLPRTMGMTQVRPRRISCIRWVCIATKECWVCSIYWFYNEPGATVLCWWGRKKLISSFKTAFCRHKAEKWP